jgi:hypothetical protein
MSSSSSISKNIDKKPKKSPPKSSFKKLASAKKKKSVKFKDGEEKSLTDNENMLEVKPGEIAIEFLYLINVFFKSSSSLLL